jgi:glycosyltransferase involved in cell wall biosynthesis
VKHVSGDPNVFVAPLGVDRTIFKESVSSRPETIFFNCGKWEVRKGHDVLVEAFNQAFTPDDNVELWMMCHNPFYTDEENQHWENLYKGSVLGDKIRIIPRQRTQQDVYNIMRQIDCGVFPSRAEGWNLELLELMSCGKHVIATNYSGHTEFCTKENSMLIHTDEKEDATDNKWFFGQGQWAKVGDKQIKQIALYMGAIHRAKQSNRLFVNNECINTAKKFSWDNTAKEIINAISA